LAKYVIRIIYMISYDYQFDQENLEIFPKEIWSDPYVIFHGTSEYHSSDIENNGIIKGKSPFDVDIARKLIELLELDDFKKYDFPKNIAQLTTARGLNGYLYSIENVNFRLSFSYLSYACVLYSSGGFKGGLSLHYINEARDIINHAVSNNAMLKSIIEDDIFYLFNKVDQILNSRGVVYAIKVPKTLDGLEMGTGAIHSTLSILKEYIIGKVIVPNNIELNQLDHSMISSKHTLKLNQSSSSIGVLIEKKNHPEDYL
jgi:hypothetical protein